MAAKVALVTDGNEESEMSIEGGRPLGGFNKPTSDGPHGSYQADELGSDSRYNHHWNNAGASRFEAVYVAKKETQ